MPIRAGADSSPKKLKPVEIGSFPKSYLFIKHASLYFESHLSEFKIE